MRVVKKIRNTGKVDSKHKNVVKYQKNVDNISASIQTNYTVKEQGNQLVVSVSKNEYTQNLQTGKVVIFPKESGTQNQIALKSRILPILEMEGWRSLEKHQTLPKCIRK